MIYKGCQKKMIMLKNTDSDLFDEAYFILKDSNERLNHLTENDMIREANRIISNNMLSLNCSGKSNLKNSTRIKNHHVGWYIAGTVTGIIMTLLSMMLFM